MSVFTTQVKSFNISCHVLAHHVVPFLLSIEHVYLYHNPVSKHFRKALQLGCKKKPSIKEGFVCEISSSEGLLVILQWARENKCYWDERTCANAALNGHLEVLKWARKNDCPWDPWTCAYAAKNAHLDILKWARENNCRWDAW